MLARDEVSEIDARGAAVIATARLRLEPRGCEMTRGQGQEQMRGARVTGTVRPRLEPSKTERGRAGCSADAAQGPEEGKAEEARVRGVPHDPITSTWAWGTNNFYLSGLSGSLHPHRAEPERGGWLREEVEVERCCDLPGSRPQLNGLHRREGWAEAPSLRIYIECEGQLRLIWETWVSRVTEGCEVMNHPRG